MGTIKKKYKPKGYNMERLKNYILSITKNNKKLKNLL